MPTLLRRALIALACLVLLVAALAGGGLALLAARPDLLKGRVEGLASAAVGARVRIAGPLGVDLGRVTTVTAEGIAVDAPEWAASPTLAEVRRLLVSVDLGAYLRDREVVLPELRLEGPRVALERDAQGRTSWPAAAAEERDATDGSAQAAPPSLPRIGDLAIEDGRVAYRDAAAGVAVEAAVATARPDPAAAAASGRDFGGLRLDGTGTVRGDPLTFGLEVGSPLVLARPGEPFPIRGALDVAGARVELDGSAADPLALKGLALALRLASEDPTKLLALAGIVAEGAPRDLAVEARLTRQDAAFELADLRARWGESRLEGGLAYDPTPERPVLTGGLRSTLLDLAALQPVAAGVRTSEPAAGEEEQGVAVPIDARVDLAADLVRLPGNAPELRGVAAGVRLEGGRLTLDPLRLGVGEGALAGRVETADLAAEPLEAALRLEASALDLASLRPFLPEGRRDLAGRLAGTLEGTLRGADAATILARSELALDAALDGLRAAGLSLAEARVAARLEGGGLRLDPLRLALAGDGGALAGTVAVAGLADAVRTSEQGAAGDPAGPLRVELDLDAQALDLAPLIALAPAAAEAAGGLAGRFTGTLEGTLAGTDAASVLAGGDATLAGSFAGLRYAGLAFERAEATARLADGALRLDPLRLALADGGGGLAGSAALAGLAGAGPDAALDATLDLDAEGLDLARLLALAPAAREAAGDLAGAFTGSLEGTLRGADAASLLARSDLALAGSFAGLRRGDLRADRAELTARLADGALRLDPLRLALPQGRLEGSVAVAGLAAAAAEVRTPERGRGGGGTLPLAAELDLAGEGVDLAALLGPGSGVGGSLRGTVRGTVRGTTPAEILARSELDLEGRVERPVAPRVGDRLGGALDITAALRPPGKAKDQPALRATAAGTAGGQPLQVELSGDDLGNLLAGRGSFPVALRASLGETRAAVDGTLAPPLATGDIDAALSLEGPDPGPVLALVEALAVKLPPYKVAGRLTRRGETYRVAGLEGRVGDSDVAGAVEVRLDGPRPRVSGELRSRLLDIDDLGGLVGAEPGTGAGETESAEQARGAAAEAGDGQVLPDDPLQTARWRSLDLDVSLRADEVRAGRVPLDGFTLRALLDAGRLRVEPLELRLGEGRAGGRVAIDASREGAPPRAELDLDLARLPLGRLLSRLEVDVSSLGTLSGRARGGAELGGQGFSVAQILGASDGEMTLLVEGGTLNRRLVTALGFDLLRVLGTVLGTAPEEVRLACAIADLVVKDGVVTTRSLAIDTAVADIGGEGTIDLGSERIDLALVADPKGIAVPAGRTGVRVAGTLADPRIELNPARLLVRGAAAATLGVFLSPLTRLADSLGVDERRRRAGSPCAALLDEAPPEGGGEGATQNR